MGQVLDVDDLATAGMIVVRMGLTRIQRVHQLMRAQQPMPGPVYVGPRTLLWNWPDVSAWAAASQRPAIDPGDWVSTEVVLERLEMDVEDLERLPTTARRRQAGADQVLWRDAEALWIERINSSGR